MANMTDTGHDYEGVGTLFCPVCNSRNLKFIEHMQEDDHYIQGHHVCNECGSDLWFQYYIDSCWVAKDGRYEEE